MQDELIYLDYAASTPVDPAVRELMYSMMGEPGGTANPSSTHAAGRQATAAIAKAAEQLAALVNTEPAKLIWTSGATESDNLAIFGAAHFRANRGKHLISMRTEHKAVVDAFERLEKSGFEVSWVPCREDGRVDRQALERAMRDDTQLVSIMHVNNELGTIQEIEQIGALCRDRDILFHVDAAQSLGKVPIDLAQLPVDLMSMTAHKIYGPKGIGALYIDERPGCHVDPMLHGGGQQRRIRPGTMPAPMIAAFGLTAEIAAARIRQDLEHLTALRERMWRGIEGIRGVSVNGDLEHSFPGILNVSVAGVEGESLVLALEPMCIATGSACNSTNADPSYVLRALGLGDDVAQSAIRFSFGRPTTEREVDFAIRHYTLAVTRLQQVAPGVTA